MMLAEEQAAASGLLFSASRTVRKRWPPVCSRHRPKEFL